MNFTDFRHQFDALASDCRYALQALRRRPRFTTIAVLTVALGIGAATSMFTVVDHVLVRPLKYKDADRLVTIWGTVSALQTDTVVGGFWNRFTVSWEDYENWLSQQTVFEETAVLRTDHVRFAGQDATRTIHSGRASMNFFSMLGARLVQGRTFSTQDADEVIVSNEFWKQELGGDSNVVGRTIRLDGGVKTIVGVLPPHFDFAGYGTNTGPVPDVWRSLQITDRAGPDYEIIGRLRQGIPIADAQLETDRIFNGLRFAFLDELAAKDRRHGANLEARHQVETGAAKTPLILMFLASGLLLLIACGNVANLLLAEARGREHEIAMRSALGASRGRVMRQLIFESLLFSLVGGILGAGIAWLAIRGIVSLAPAGLPRINEIAVDMRVLFFVLTVAAMSGILFGLAPAVALARTNLVETLKNRGEHRGSSKSASQSLVVVVEISICFMLLIGGSLLVRSLIRLSHVDPGFNPSNLLAVQVWLPMQNYQGPQILSLYQRLFRELESLPGVTAVTGSSYGPFQEDRSISTATINGQAVVIENREIWSNYFDAVGGRFVEGRAFTAKEVYDGAKVVIINKTLARKFWPNESAINKRIEHVDSYDTIIGVTDDVRQLGLGVTPPPMYYIPMNNDPMFTILLRTPQNPLNAAPAVRSRIRSMDDNIAINWIRPMEDLVRASYAEERYRTVLITVFATIAGFLALIGLYGVMSRYVAYRNRELGIRLAIGAQPRRVLGLILYKGLVLTAAGILIGGFAAVIVNGALTKYLFGVDALDIWTYAGVALILSAIALMTVYVPARRASLIDPVRCLKAE